MSYVSENKCQSYYAFSPAEEVVAEFLSLE